MEHLIVMDEEGLGGLLNTYNRIVNKPTQQKDEHICVTKKDLLEMLSLYEAQVISKEDIMPFVDDYFAEMQKLNNGFK